MFHDFKYEIKVFLIVVVVAIILAVGTIVPDKFCRHSGLWKSKA